MNEPPEIPLSEQLRGMNEIPARPSAIAQVGKTAGQHYSSPLNSVHGPARPPAPAVAYECADCQDLYERLRKVFKEMGHEF
jgi:hypothetical protein